MDFLDDYAVNSDDDEILTTSEPSRPNKRRRLNQSPDLSDDEESPSSPDEYDLPSNENQSDDDFNNPKSKYDAVMHVPVFAESQRDEFVTQVEQPWSSPTAIRGPRWQKKTSAIPFKPASPTKRAHTRAVTMPEPPAVRIPDPSVSAVLDEFDDDDAELFEALITGESGKAMTNAQSQVIQARQQSKSMRQTTLFGMNTTQTERTAATQSRTHNWPMASRDEKPTHHKINRGAMQTWTYPLNVGTIRDYQFNIVHRALFHNILVALPTGLGKTFIAATVMLNYFNWTQDSQIIFVAPTKPLVTQQVNACFHIAGIPRSQTTLLTGEIQPAIRAEEWQEKRVFFMTPQTLINDLKTGMADPKRIVLLVVDEAHRATGNYAYVEVVRFLRRFNSSFRVLALTATPGGNVEAVQKVIDGLDIARVEIRTEESMDIRNFVHTRNENFQLFDNSEEIEMCLDLLSTALKPVLAKVNSLNAYFSNDPKTMTLYGLVKGREQWAKSEAGRSSNWGLKSMVQSCFKPLMTMAHNLELLKFHGIGPFYQNMKVFDEEAGAGKYVRQIVESESYKTLMTRLKAWVNDDDFEGHPKLTYLSELVLNHFMDAGDGRGAAGGRPPSDTRIMIFAHYRDSAEEIVRILNRHQPMIRAHVFVGQAGTKRSEGMDQKTQIDIIKKFKTGTYNTLVATSIGEEGLDIGEVDLIVCYDCSKSPIRMLQRMGRTGRKRAGNIVLLLMRGKEERDYHAAKDNYLKMQSIIESGKDFLFHEDMSPRIVPRDIQPVADKRCVEIPLENTQADDIPEPKKRKAKPLKRPPKKFHMPDDVETGFQFLGNRKKTAAQKHVAKKTEPKWDINEAILPPLTNVLLRVEDEEDLERRFAQVAGDEVQYVQGVRLDNFPETMRKSSETKLVTHSSTTRRLLKASKAMCAVGQDWTRPTRLDIITDFRSEHTTPGRNVSVPCARDIFEQDPSSPAGNSSARSTQDEDYDLNDDFLDDSHLAQNMVSSTPGSDVGRVLDKGQYEVPDRALENPSFNSQKSIQDSDSDSDDMPAMDKILVRQSTEVAKKARSTNKLKERANKTRRIVSDDSDE